MLIISSGWPERDEDVHVLPVHCNATLTIQNEIKEGARRVGMLANPAHCPFCLINPFIILPAIAFQQDLISLVATRW